MIFPPLPVITDAESQAQCIKTLAEHHTFSRVRFAQTEAIQASKGSKEDERGGGGGGGKKGMYKAAR